MNEPLDDLIDSSLRDRAQAPERADLPQRVLRSIYAESNSRPARLHLRWLFASGLLAACVLAGITVLNVRSSRIVPPAVTESRRPANHPVNPQYGSLASSGVPSPRRNSPAVAAQEQNATHKQNAEHSHEVARDMPLLAFSLRPPRATQFPTPLPLTKEEVALQRMVNKHLQPVPREQDVNISQVKISQLAPIQALTKEKPE